MRLFLATMTMVLALSSIALARPAGPEPATQQSGPGATAPNGRIGEALGQTHEPVAAAPTAVAPAVAPAPDSDGGPATIVFVLIGLGAAMVLFLGGYFGVRYRHRVAIADDLAVE